MFRAGSQGVPLTSIILVFFALTVWFVVDIMKSNFRGNDKIRWILLVTFIPIAGLIIYYFVGVKQKITQKTHYSCPNCREFVLREEHNCKYCGIKLLPDAIRNISDKQIEHIRKNVYEVIASTPKENIISCPYCNQSIRSDSKECPFCGMFIPENLYKKETR
jgi:RNA polymerase subunit RPABC4/transcription elongation factor Spt4